MRLLTFLFLFVSSLGYCQDKKTISLEDIYIKNTFRAEAVAGFRSMKDGRYYSEIASDGNLQKVRFSDGKVEKIMLNTKSINYQNQELKIDDYSFNNDESKLLLFTESENIYRRSVLHKVYAYDIATKKIQLISNQKILHASFSPQSDKVAYVFENNMFFIDLNTEETIQVTKDGSYNIINGNCDWVYEEEFEFTKAYEWDQDGNYLAYYRFDQTAVPEFNFAQYDGLYPKDYRYKYPKAGEKNSNIEIKIYHIENERTLQCDIGNEEDIYIPRIKINKFRNSLIVYRLNRLQNHLELLEINPKNGRSTIIFEEKNKAYIEIDDNIQFLASQDAFVYLSEKDGFNHLYLHEIASNASSQITRGNWEVVSLLGIDEKKKTIYYLSSEMSALERNLFSISFNGESKLNLTPEKGWHDIYLSRSFDFFMDKYSYLNTPPIYSIKNNLGNLVRTLKDNQTLKTKMLDYDLSKIEFIQVPNGEGIELNGWMMKPTNFDATKKYPLLMFQYSGPGSQQVMNQFGLRDYWWYQLLTQKGYIIVCVDGTGTGFRGESFKKKTYLQLGKYESDDQIAVAKYFAQQTYIDASRIGIWGWSYGGFMSSICLFKGADVFKAAIAVAPVTNWRYYDNIYTERYMRTPEVNAKGYDDNSPINMVKQLKGNFLLIHGTADDNVHYQNSMMMVDEMIKANKDFDSEFYPNKNHGISGGNTRYHLYKRMTNFILEKL